MAFDKKVALVTGASSGIGRALALELARQGAAIVLVARRKDRLEKLVKECASLGAQAISVEADVTQDGALEKAVTIAREAFGKIDIVIANAGFGVVGPLERLTLEDYRRQFETNVFGVLRTVYATLGELKKSQGRLAVVGSVMSHVSLSGASAYAMSKYSVRALTEALRSELHPAGVSVTLVSPGFVQSEIWQIDNKGMHREGGRDSVPSWLRAPADKAAREILWAIDKRKAERIITFHGKVIVFLNRHFHCLVEFVKGRGIRGRPEPK